MSSSIVIGPNSTASNKFGTVIGQNASAANQNNIVIGRSAYASNTDSISVGKSASSQGSSSIAIGSSAMTIGQYSIAIGSPAKASKNYSIAIGGNATNLFEATALIKVGKNNNTALSFYIFGQGSLLSSNTGGEAGIGYTIGANTTGGCKKLSELLTDTFTLPS